MTNVTQGLFPSPGGPGTVVNNSVQQQPPDPDEDDYFCPSLNGMGPHNYIFQVDFVAAKSILYCSQCGDTIELAAVQPGTLPTP